MKAVAVVNITATVINILVVTAATVVVVTAGTAAVTTILVRCTAAAAAFTGFLGRGALVSCCEQ